MSGTKAALRDTHLCAWAELSIVGDGSLRDLTGGHPVFGGSEMTLRKTLIASVLMLVLGAANAFAQQQTGEIFGKAADTSGAILPGATVTVSGPALIQPRVAVTSETGTYRIPELPIGAYTVTFELAGFRTMALQDIKVTIGFRAQVNAAMELSTVQ